MSNQIFFPGDTVKRNRGSIQGPSEVSRKVRETGGKLVDAYKLGTLSWHKFCPYK